MHLISAYGDWKPLRTRKRRTHTIEKNLSDAADMIKIWRNKIWRLDNFTLIKWKRVTNITIN